MNAKWNENFGRDFDDNKKRNEYIGIKCETQCPPGHYGENCHEQCNCKNNSSCDANTGVCVCSRGWEGPDCNQPCKEGYYGVGCKEKCPEKTQGKEIEKIFVFHNIIYYCKKIFISIYLISVNGIFGHIFIIRYFFIFIIHTL